MLCLDHVFENGSRDRRMGRGQGVKFLQALKVELAELEQHVRHGKTGQPDCTATHSSRQVSAGQ